MKYTVQNENYSLSALTLGAELTGFETKRDNYEYIWQKCDIWQGQSPLLFPVVGKLRDDRLVLESGVYDMPKHGFAKGSEFKLISLCCDEMVFELTQSPETKKIYPFDFTLRVRYVLLSNGFTMGYTVKNTGKAPMYFSLGAHPAFNIALGDRVVTFENETVKAWRLGDNKLIKPEQTEAFNGGNEFTVTGDVFRDDALIFEGLSSKGCRVVKADGRSVRVNFGGAPCVGMWAKPGAGYVCIEPWYGLDDRWDAEGGFEHKKYVQKLEAGAEWRFEVQVEAE